MAGNLTAGDPKASFSVLASSPVPQLLTISLISTSPQPSAFLPLLFTPEDAENHLSGPLPDGELDNKMAPLGAVGGASDKAHGCTK